MTDTSIPARMRNLRSSLLVAVLGLLGTGCATTVGTIAGPVTGPITYWNHTYGMGAAKPLLLPFTIPLGPILGFVQGARADVGFMAHGEYGVGNAPPFDLVWDPASTVWDPGSNIR